MDLRDTYLGYYTAAHKWSAFVISGLFSGLAGGLYTLLINAIFAGAGGVSGRPARFSLARLLKKAHLRGPILRTGAPAAWALAAAYVEYASLGASRAA